MTRNEQNALAVKFKIALSNHRENCRKDCEWAFAVMDAAEMAREAVHWLARGELAYAKRLARKFGEHRAYANRCAA